MILLALNTLFSLRHASATSQFANLKPCRHIKAGFAAECCRQSKLAAEADVADMDLLDLMDDILTDIDG